jgi:hypothetical protein
MARPSDRYQHAAAAQRQLGVVGEGHAVIVLAPQHDGCRRMRERLRSVGRERAEVVQQDGLAARGEIRQPRCRLCAVVSIRQPDPRHRLQQIRRVRSHPRDHRVSDRDAEPGGDEHECVELVAPRDLERDHGTERGPDEYAWPWKRRDHRTDGQGHRHDIGLVRHRQHGGAELASGLLPRQPCAARAGEDEVVHTVRCARCRHDSRPSARAAALPPSTIRFVPLM